MNRGKNTHDNEHLTVKALPEEERPYEKCERYGPAFLTDAELLAVIIRSGTHDQRATDLAFRILNLDSRYNGINSLLHLSVGELKRIRGIGRAKAVQLVCAGELARRISLKERLERDNFSEVSAAAGYFIDRMGFLEHEEVHVMYLDTKLGFITSECIYKGTLDRSILEPRGIFSAALKCNAACFILAHNHPSGDPAPSDMDIAATKRIRDCGNIMGIRMFDHIIVGDGIYVSMKEEGIL